MRRKRIYAIWCCTLFVLMLRTDLSRAKSANRLVIGGAGPSTRVVTLLGREFCKKYPGQEIIVPAKSIKHSGSLDWILRKGQLFGRTGRPLSDQEKQRYPMVEEIPIANVKIRFAVQKSLGISNISMKQWKNIYLRKIESWSDVGGPNRKILLLGREKTEAALSEIQRRYPFFQKVSFDSTYGKDHILINALKQIPGGIGFATEFALASEDNIKVLHIQDVDVGMNVGLVYKRDNKKNVTVRQMTDFINSSEWKKILQDNGFSPAGQRP